MLRVASRSMKGTDEQFLVSSCVLHIPHHYDDNLRHAHSSRGTKVAKQCSRASAEVNHTCYHLLCIASKPRVKGCAMVEMREREVLEKIGKSKKSSRAL